jgi:DNA-binding SARP family transcriptional activator/tetratricopeptide (TPR) repeat protein
VRFKILGPTELIDHEKSVPLGAAKQRGMLAMLLYRAGEPVRAETLIEHLWLNTTNTNHRRALYSLASRLRAVLGRVGLTGALTRVANTDSYRLLIDPDLVDYHQFRRSLAEARDAASTGDHERSAATLIGALALWHGEPLTELCGPASEDLRRRLNDMLLDGHKLLALSWLRTGRHESVLTQLEPLVDDHCLDEALARSWIGALSAAGRQDEARRFLIDFRRRFRREMRAEADLGPDVVAGPTSAGGPQHPVPSATPHQLPKNIADFTGRAEIIRELDELEGPDQPQGRVVVITGMPGVGKTTLATYWAHRQRPHFPDGQLYLNAGAYGPSAPVEPNDALDRFLRALDVPADRMPITFEQRRDRFNQLLHGRRVLIVLDNVFDAAQARALTPDSDTCTTIITSRTRLSGLTIRDGIRQLTVPPLGDAESVELLRQIIGGSRSDAEPESITLIARLAEGHPLALRVIGEHIAERPRAGISDLAIELRDHLLDASGEIDDATSLSTVFAWSYDALSDDAALLFRRLAVHPGPNISAEAANAVVGADIAHTPTLLNVLAKAHLINHDTARRYRFHDLLRLYALDRVAVEDDRHEIEHAQRRLLDWYLLSAANAAATLAPEWPAVPELPEPDETRPMSFETDVDAMRWCATERENLCAVSKWAALNGYHRHGWQIPGAIHEIFERYGRQDDVLQLTELALQSAQRDGHEVGQIGTLNNLGAIYLTMHAYARAASTFAIARDLANATGRIEEEPVCTHNLGSAYLSSGQTQRAIGAYTLALAGCRKISDPAGEAATLHRLGDTYLYLTQYAEAADHYFQALRIREHIGALRGRGITHSRLANLYLVSDDLPSAMRHCTTALAIHQRTNDQATRCDTLITLTDVQVRLGMFAEALESGRQSVAIGDEIADSHRRAHALAALADALAQAGTPAAADQPCRTALHILDEVADANTHSLRERLLRTQHALDARQP